MMHNFILGLWAPCTDIVSHLLLYCMYLAESLACGKLSRNIQLAEFKHFVLTLEVFQPWETTVGMFALYRSFKSDSIISLSLLYGRWTNVRSLVTPWAISKRLWILLVPPCKSAWYIIFLFISIQTIRLIKV